MPSGRMDEDAPCVDSRCTVALQLTVHRRHVSPSRHAVTEAIAITAGRRTKVGWKVGGVGIKHPHRCYLPQQFVHEVYLLVYRILYTTTKNLVYTHCCSTGYQVYWLYQGNHSTGSWS